MTELTVDETGNAIAYEDPYPRRSEICGFPLPPFPEQINVDTDGWNRYKPPSPTTGKLTAYTRATTVAGGGSISLSGIAEHRTVTCTGGAVEISGINNTVEITGHCDRVGVSGIENIVTLESADVIEASGISNRVTYHSGDPRIDSSGSDVTVTQG